MRPNINIIRGGIIALALALVIAGCAPATLPTQGPVEPTIAPTATVPPTEAAPTQTATGGQAEGTPAVTLDTSGVAGGSSSQVIAAVPADPNAAWWQAMPQYTLLTLEGYPISGHLMQPQIFVYPVKDLAVNEVAAKVAQDLGALLQSQQPGENLPYLPLYNAAQIIHPQVKYLDFKDGKGVRYLTEFDQAPLPINNHELLYTYQGLTADGQYYVAAVLPVNLPGLPASEIMTGTVPPDYISTFPKYLSDTVAMLEGQPASAFTPDLSKLDAMMQSLEVK